MDECNISSLASGSYDKCNKMGPLLKEVFFVHNEMFERLNLEVKKHKSRCAQMESLKQEDESKMEDLQQQLGILSTKHQELIAETERLQDRLSLPCENCKTLTSRLSEQDKMLEVFMPMLLLKDDNILGKIVKQYFHIKTKKKKLKHEEMETLIESCSQLDTEVGGETCQISPLKQVNIDTSYKSSCPPASLMGTRPSSEYGHFDGESFPINLTEVSDGHSLGVPLRCSTQRRPLQKNSGKTSTRITGKFTASPKNIGETSHPHVASMTMVSHKDTVDEVGEQWMSKGNVITIESSQDSSGAEDVNGQNQNTTLPLLSSDVEISNRENHLLSENSIKSTNTTYVRKSQVSASVLTSSGVYGSRSRNSTMISDRETPTPKKSPIVDPSCDSIHDDQSPESRRSCKLSMAGKRARTRYSEEPLPERKKPKVSSILKVTLPSIQDIQDVALEPEMVAVNKSNDSIDESSSPVKSRKVKMLSDIVIPETMPMEMDDTESDTTDADSCHGDNSDNDASSRFPTQDTVLSATTKQSNRKQTSDSVPFSPPSQSSTPVPQRNLKAISEELGIRSLSQKDVNNDPEEHICCQSRTQSESFSPVFGGHPQMRTSTSIVKRERVVQSPSLFDASKYESGDCTKDISYNGESPSVIKSLASTGKSCPREVLCKLGLDISTDAETSALSCTSPSVLSGKILNVSLNPNVDHNDPVALGRVSKINSSPILKQSASKDDLSKHGKLSRKASPGITFEKVQHDLVALQESTKKRKKRAKMLQTKLSVHAFNTRRAVELARVGDQPISKTLSAEEEEQLILDQVKEASLETFHQEKREATVFKQPGAPASDISEKLTSQIVKEKTPHFKPNLVREHQSIVCAVQDSQTLQEYNSDELNGSMDPNLCLSLYMSQKSDTGSSLDKPCSVTTPHRQEMVSIWELDGNTTISTATQKSHDGTETSSGKSSSSRRKTRVKNPTKPVMTSQRITRSSQGSNSQDSAKRELDEDISVVSAVFPGRAVLNIGTGIGNIGMNEGDSEALPDIDDSYDRPPKKNNSPGYAFAAVVRKQAERKKLKTYTCSECYHYFQGQDLSEAEMEKRMEACRHRAKYIPPSTPEHYWSVGFPDTQECHERGYLQDEQAKPSSFRRRQGYKQLFNKEGVSDDESS